MRSSGIRRNNNGRNRRGDSTRGFSVAENINYLQPDPSLDFDYRHHPNNTRGIPTRSRNRNNNGNNNRRRGNRSFNMSDLELEFEEIDFSDSFQSGFTNSSSEVINNNRNYLPLHTNFKNKCSITPDEAINLLDQLTIRNSLFKEYMEDDRLLNLFMAAAKFDKSNIYQLLKSINSFIQWNDMKTYIMKLLFLLLNSNFTNEVLKNLIQEFMLKIPSVVEMEIILTFFICFMELSPQYFKEQLMILYPTVLVCCENFKETRIETLKSEFRTTFEKIKNDISKPNCEIIVKNISTSIPDEQYRNIPVVPGSSDIFCLNEEVILQCNKIQGKNDLQNIAYESVDAYLNTQFRLLREDFLRPLRDSIAKIRENMCNTNKLSFRDIQVRIYENVLLEDLLPSRNGIVYKVKFDISKFSAKMDWKKARRFIHGSLLCFTNNYFDTIYFASVIESDPKNLCKGHVMVQFDNDPISEILANKEFLMLETKNLFEAYRHVLSKLQKFTSKTLPFVKYFVYAENEVENPSFMNAQDIQNINYLSTKDLEMDNSQKLAFQNSLKSNISLVQGPPGTGKTYVGLKIIKYLSNYFQISDRNIGPILVVCYTNHALDQFLEDIVSVLGAGNVLRVGGRSKSEAIMECNINNIKRKWITKKCFPHQLFKNIISCRHEIENVENIMVDFYIKITNLDGKLLSQTDLSSSMNLRERLYFQNINFENWIRGSDILIDNTIVNLSENINSFMLEIQTEVINMSLCEMLNILVQEICDQILIDENKDDQEPDIEDPEAFLINQRLLDDDLDIMLSTKKFKALYNKLKLEKNIKSSDPSFQYVNEFKAVANSKIIKRKLKKTKPLTEEKYQQLQSFDVEYEVRLQLYKYWVEKYKNSLIASYMETKCKYDQLSKHRQKLNNKEYELIMKEAKVIGMTTTGAARYGSVLDNVGCKVVVIEEAAEVLEAHVICSLSEHCQQLIMIGDHKQLRPKVDVYDLEINYNLGFSLFERLILNNCQYFTLQYQHRMRPEISKCVKSIYPDLLDSDSVFIYPNIAGMMTDLYFFNHPYLEDMSNDTSYKNDFEANFITEFCRYLVLCGNLPSKITVITFYTGQLYNINNRMKSPVFKGIRICVVDNFQGEENDIIILSLVRSNIRNEVGFVKSENRLCVALSRAKRGFYVIGNMTMLCKNISLLNEIVKDYIPKQNIGSKLPLQCSLHPKDNNMFVMKTEDFKKSCPSICGMILNCGHNCSQKCHMDNLTHLQYQCRFPCLKKCKRELHNCKYLCFQKCKCDEEINLRLKCDHVVLTFCFMKADQIICPEICEKMLNCGHICEDICGNKCVCKKLLDFKLPCGHHQAEVCGTNIAEIKCKNKCNKSLSCLHICEKKCWEKCLCERRIEYILLCDHKQFEICGTELSTIKCMEKRQKSFECGHQIEYYCWQKLKTCDKIINKTLECGHSEMVECNNKDEIINCSQLCNGNQTSCCHKCLSRCGECMKGRFHRNCVKKCNNKLKCGHRCQSICHNGSCPPCLQNCTLSCKHIKCLMKCYEICSNETCSLKCGKKITCIKCKKQKDCPGICGQSCLQYCDPCKPDEDFNRFYIMKCCECKIIRKEFQPKMDILENDVILKCQICQKNFLLPYTDLALKHYNIFRSMWLKSITDVEIEEFTLLFDKFKLLKLFDIDIIDSIFTNIKENKIFNSSNELFALSFKFYGDILETTSKIITNSKTLPKLEVYNEKVRNSLRFLLVWLDPTVRRFTKKEIDDYEKEISLLNLVNEIIKFTNSASIHEYALIFQKSYSLLDEIFSFYGDVKLNNFRQKYMNIKSDIGQHNSVSENEETLVARIINAKDIYIEFQIVHLSDVEKLKEIKSLIRKCHPDKNKSLNASKAFQSLNILKEKLKSSIH